MTRGAMLLTAAVLAVPAAPVSGRLGQLPAASADIPSVLKAGGSAQRSLYGGEPHVYSVELRAGECAAIAVEQRGVDVIVRVLDASGNAAAEFDDETSNDGREAITIVAGDTGPQRFSVSARYPRHEPGTYAVWIEAIRPATDRDRAIDESRRLRFEASRFRTSGKLDDALDRATRALNRAEQTLGPLDRDVGVLSMIVAGVQRAKGDRRGAEQSYQRAIEIDEAALGRQHPQTALAIELLGDLYNDMDDKMRAEPLLVESAAIIERTLGEHPRLAGCLNDLAGLHLTRGDYDRALIELQRANGIYARWLSPDDFDAIAIVHNIGDVNIRKGEYDRAVPYLEQALAAIERTLGKDNYRLAAPLLNLAIVARERKDYSGAVAYIDRAYDVRMKAYGAEHTQTAALLITKGNIYLAQGDYAKALDAYGRASDVLERTAGPYHSFTMMAMANAARTYIAAGQLDEALALQSKYDALIEKSIDFNLAVGSEREQLTYLEGTFEKMWRTISLHLEQLPQSEAAADLAASAILRRKGRVLDAVSESHGTLRARLTADDQRLLDDDAAITKKLSQLALAGPGRTPAAEFRKQLAALEQERESLERRISQRSAQFRAERQAISLTSVREALPPGAALIEYVAYEPFNAKAATDRDLHGEPRYAAYVIRLGAPTTGLDLGPLKAIDAAVTSLRQALRDPVRTDVTALARELDALVLRPVRARIGASTQLLIAPDGALNLIPFEALVDERGRFQVERYAISYLGSGRDVLRIRADRSAATGPPLVVADPEFGEPPVATRAVYFPPLDGTSQEAASIGRQLPGAVVLTGARATKDALTRAVAPSILHIASHAFFLPEGGPQQTAVEGTRSMTPTVQSPNPLLRSGIALAGANLSRSGDAGILTGLEASTLNLWGTHLVTLSACDTGVGDVKTGEGVYGLRRAFFVAGAESLVMSLWPVSDQITRTVMTKYYTGLARGEGRDAALRHVQRAMLADAARRHPYYWAGFIQAGDWTPLPTKGATRW